MHKGFSYLVCKVYSNLKKEIDKLSTRLKKLVNDSQLLTESLRKMPSPNQVQDKD